MTHTADSFQIAGIGGAVAFHTVEPWLEDLLAHAMGAQGSVVPFRDPTVICDASGVSSSIWGHGLDDLSLVLWWWGLGLSTQLQNPDFQNAAFFPCH